MKTNGGSSVKHASLYRCNCNRYHFGILRKTKYLELIEILHIIPWMCCVGYRNRDWVGTVEAIMAK